MKPFRILLGDDHPLVLKGVRGLLEGRYEIVDAVESGQALIEAAIRLNPDLVVLDVSMPILSGIDAAREIKKSLPLVKFVFLSMHARAIYLRRVLELGALGYVLKSAAAEELVTGIEQARRGQLYISPGFGPELLENARNWRPSHHAKSQEGLTDRQNQILQLIAEGKQNKEIAEIFHISVRTVEFHRSRLMARLGARGVAELTKLAIQEGLIDEIK